LEPGLEQKAVCKAAKVAAGEMELLPLMVAIDLWRMAPMDAVLQIQGGISSASTAKMVIKHF
jgi:hypothetical protein